MRSPSTTEPTDPTGTAPGDENRNAGERCDHAKGAMSLLTKDRVGGALVIVAAIVGLVLVFTGPGSEGSEGSAGGDTDIAPPSSQVSPAPGSQVPPPAPGQSQPPAPAQPQQDNDGDSDGD